MTANQIVGREIAPDSASSACAACGHVELVATRLSHGGTREMKANVAGSRVTVDGVRIMLCLNAAACCERYRSGISPGLYAAALRNGMAPFKIGASA